MFGDDDHSHPVLGCITILNSALLLVVIYLLLSNGVIDPRSLPIPAPLANLVGLGSDAEDEIDEGLDVPTPGPGTRSPTRGAVTATPGSGFGGGESVRVRRAAEFRSSPNFKEGVFCTLADETPGTIINQDPERSIDATGRSRLIYPVALRDATCEGGGQMDELKGWVSEDFLRR